ncbi:uncharacterized protein LOC129940875 [Eupeodes corollae]|uniref:uncharacterized protein LOC129940875 n=1 Tax=Eupeodes corollae TaxID=290404 RepID=UPI0024927743|nr:uncharacterized protein LOC129940875 [Eupeodes corollae]
MLLNVVNFVVVFVIVSYQTVAVKSDHLIVYLSQHGLHGEITFKQGSKTSVEIRSKLETTLQFPDQAWSWGIHEFPVDYTETNANARCDLHKLGKQLISFDDDLGFLTLPGNETSMWTKEIQLTGENGIWGKSLVLTDGSTRVCGSVTTVDANVEHMAEAQFTTPISGSVYFRWLAGNKGSGDTLIYSDLFHIRSQPVPHNDEPATKHHWKIYVTDILANDHHRNEDNCNFLQLVFDPQGNGEGKGIGDLDNRLGKIKVAKNALELSQRSIYKDNKLELLPSDLTIPHRTLYLVLFDHLHTNEFLACTKIRNVKPLLYKTFFNSGGIKGEISFSERSRFDPTFLNFTLSSTGRDTDRVSKKFAEDVSGFRIHSLPPDPIRKGKPDYCISTDEIFNPHEIDMKAAPPPGFGTQEQYAIGDLSGKLQSRNKDYYHNYKLPGASSELSGIYWDIFLPLQGINSIVHRGMVIYTFDRSNPENIKEEPWGCSTIAQYQKNGIYQKPISTAQVLFRYPIVGRVLFRQPAEEPWMDTTVIFEYLIHADGSTQNNTFGHRWAVHASPPGKDFYDWQNRCTSAGNVYNPYRVDWGEKRADDFCRPHLMPMCKVGALDTRLGSLAIAGRKSEATKISRKIFTDSNLPLSGKQSIMGKSLVIYDDNGPKARGERLACSVIIGHFKRKVVAKDWYPNGYDLSLKGELEITQQSEYDMSNIEVDLRGLNAASGYHIHEAPVEENLAFPCEATSLYDHWNPFGINPKLSPPPTLGSTDQYEMGDLSGKFGTLDGLRHYEGAHNDSNLPLFGYNSILGRSIVIHKKEKNARWACSTLERGYSPSEARELRAIASFHHPSGYAYGYIKMTQLIHYDGSQSDTVIEVKLRHPGKNDRNVTQNHKWQIFVNSVGVDAAVKPTATRCVAGGYVWNPYFTQLADPLNTELYDQECGSDNPLRCYVGDVSSRLGPINIGEKRMVFTDPNFPLEKPVGAIGRSIVIFAQDWSNERFACANIEPDHNIVKFVNIQKPPRFVVAQFLEDLREVMGIPEWMLNVDARRTKELHGGACIQLVIHFKGPLAHQLELDMSRLIAAGRLDAPTLYIAGYVNQKRKATLSYRSCGVRDTNPNRKSSTFRGNGSSKPKTFLLLYIFTLSIFHFIN